MITIGIDPHKSSLTAVAMDASGESMAAIRAAVMVTTTGSQLQQRAGPAGGTVAGRWEMTPAVGRKFVMGGPFRCGAGW